MVNKIYGAPETSITWTDSGGDELMDLGGLASDGVVMGSFLDLGAASRATRYHYELTIDGFDTPTVIGQIVKLHLSYSNATTNFDGNPTTDPTTSAEGTMTVAQLVNTDHIDNAKIYSTTEANELKVSGIVTITARYVSPVIHNATQDALLSTADAHTFVLTPIPPEVQ